MKVKIKTQIGMVVPVFMILFASLSVSLLDPSPAFAAAAKCYYYGPLTDDKPGTVSFDCRTIEAEYKELAGEDFKGFKQDKCYLLSDLPKPSAKEANCAKMEEAVRETEKNPTVINEPEPSSDSETTGSSEGCGDIDTSIIKCNNRGGNPLMSIIIQVINFLAVGVGIAVVGGIIWGGMMYASSNGDAGKTKQGVTVIVNAIVGLLLFMFMYAFINFIVPGGVFN